ncbi:hypothetical protein FQN54_006153 [Arachnomyces sp. PD_36]|nr:hypothetical protein FQN54_006153 [Arachnomyces sp. PD_36]
MMYTCLFLPFLAVSVFASPTHLASRAIRNPVIIGTRYTAAQRQLITDGFYDALRLAFAARRAMESNDAISHALYAKYFLIFNEDPNDETNHHRNENIKNKIKARGKLITRRFRCYNDEQRVNVLTAYVDVYANILGPDYAGGTLLPTIRIVDDYLGSEDNQPEPEIEECEDEESVYESDDELSDNERITEAEAGYACTVNQFEAVQAKLRLSETPNPKMVICPPAWGFTGLDHPDKTCQNFGDAVSDRMEPFGATLLHEYTHYQDLVAPPLDKGTGDQKYGYRDSRSLHDRMDSFYNADTYSWFAIEAYWSQECQRAYL